MKKFLSGILFLLISVFIFADSSASVEGVIEVAGKDELPAGYFGKAAGYLPGDSVSITNPNTGITLQILNLGTLDASGGIAILISEESAKSLGIERNSGVKVKLAPRSGYFDETVSGNAVLDEKTLPAAKEEPVSDVSAEPAVQAGPEAASQPAENAAVSVEPAAPVAVAGVPLIADTEDSAEEEDAEVAAVEDEAETPVDEIDSEDETDFSDEEKLSAEPVEEEVSADDEPSVEEETEPVIVEAPAPTEECEVPEEPYEDYESVEDGFLESKEAVEQPSPAEESEVEAVTVEEPDPIEEETEDLPEEENAELVIVEEPQEEEPETPTEEEAVTVEEPSPIEEDSAAEENQMEEVSEPEEVVAEPNAEPEAQSSGESESSDYAPIVLVPSEPESPEPPVDASIENEPIEIVPVESVPEEKTAEPEPLQTEYPVSIQDYVVSSESALASNCYYIQIATMGNIKNIENILVKYSKYPVSLIPAGKNYRVLVGPLSVDEYGAVLAKFKNAGFKDAFVRKR